MAQDNLDEKIKKAEKIYNEAMLKLSELQLVHRKILDSAKKRVEQSKINKIKQNLKF